MRRFACGLTLLAVGLAGWCSLEAPPAPAAGPPPKPLGRAQVARLVADLGGDDLSARTEAARRLGALPHVPLALREAAAARGAGARRAAAVVAAIEKRVAPLALKRAAAWAKQGEVDLALESVAV